MDETNNETPAEDTQPDQPDALVYMEDVYSGPGLKGCRRSIRDN